MPLIYVEGLSDEQIESANSADLIVASIPKRENLSLITDIFTDFTVLWTLDARQRNHSSFESLFLAKREKLLRHGKTVRIDESLMALILLAQSGAEDLQWISILGAAWNTLEDGTTQGESSQGPNSKIKYHSSAPVLRPCGKPKIQDRACRAKSIRRTI